MKNKQTVLAVIALVVVVALMGTLWLLNRPETSRGAKTVTITVVHGDESTKTFTCRTDAEYLDRVLLDEKIAEGDKTEYGLTIHTVDGEKADWNVNQSYWALFVGEEYATTGASGTPVHDGDSFSLVYTIG